MKIIKKYVSSLIALVLVFSMVFNGCARIATILVADKKETVSVEETLSNGNETLTIEDSFKTQITMLNYLTLVTQEIKENKSKVLLDSIYNNLGNGMHLDAVDTKTQDYISDLANSVFELKMLDIKKSRIEYLYEQERAGAIKSAIPNPIGLLSAVRSVDILSLVISGAYMTIDSVAGYEQAIQQADAEYLKNGWDIEDAELNVMNDINSELWDYKNNMRRDYNIPSDLILDKDKIKDFVKFEHSDNVDSQIVFFENNIETYKGYPMIWLVLARCYYKKAMKNMDENGNGILEYLIKCIEAVKKYEENSARIFKKDAHLAKVIPLVIASAEKTQSDSEYINTAKYYLEILEKNMKNSDWDLQYFAAQTYVDIYGRTKDIEYLDKAYNKAKSNVVYLVPEQKKMNNEYENEYVEQKPKRNASEKEKKEIKEINEFYKKRKEERKYEFPPILESLKLNLDLLFELAKLKGIDDTEKQNLDSILHIKGEKLFLFVPLDDNYKYNLSEDINYADNIKTVSKDCLLIPIGFICEDSVIKATYQNSSTQKTYYGSYSVDRKKKEVKITFNRKKGGDYKKIDFKVDKDTKLHIDFNPLGEENSKVYTADFINNGGIGIFNGFKRAN